MEAKIKGEGVINKEYEQIAIQLCHALSDLDIPYTMQTCHVDYRWFFPFCSGQVAITNYTHGSKYGLVDSVDFPWDGDGETIHSVEDMACLIEYYYVKEWGKWK